MTKGRLDWQDGEESIRAWVEDWAAPDSSVVSECLHGSAQRSLHRLEKTRESALGESAHTVIAPIVVKIHHTASGRHRLRESIKRGIGYAPVDREWRALTKLHAAGAPVPRPLGRGALPDGDAFLVTEYLEGPDLLPLLASGDESERTAWVDGLARSVASLHASGFRHGDLHLGNLRIHRGQIMIVDLQSARRAWSRREQLRDLAHLDFSIARRGFGIDCRRRLRRELGNPSGLDVASRAFVRDFLRGRSRREHRIGQNWEAWQSHHPEVDGSSSPLRSFEGLKARDVEVAPLVRALHEAIGDATPPDRRGGRTRISAHADDADSGSIIVKRTTMNGWRDSLDARVRGSSALRGFRSGQRLALIGSLGARTLAALDERRAGHSRTSWLFLEGVGRFDLDEYRPGSEEEARRCSLALLRWIAEWHAWGIEHLDLKGGNIRIDDRNGVFEFWLIDLGDIRLRRNLSDAVRRKALVQLNASLADEAFSASARLAALDDYLERLPFHGVRRKDLVESIVRQSLARNHRWRGERCETSD